MTRDLPLHRAPRPTPACWGCRVGAFPSIIDWSVSRLRHLYGSSGTYQLTPLHFLFFFPPPFVFFPPFFSTYFATCSLCPRAGLGTFPCLSDRAREAAGNPLTNKARPSWVGRLPL